MIEVIVTIIFGILATALGIWQALLQRKQIEKKPDDIEPLPQSNQLQSLTLNEESNTTSLPPKRTRPSKRIPKGFVCFSSENSSIADNIRVLLDQIADVTLWDQDSSQASMGTSNNIIQANDKFEFGVFLLSQDDIASSNGANYLALRNNILFELELFVRKHGKEKSFLIIPGCNPSVLLPSNLSGITTVIYDASNKDTDAALQSAIHDVKQVISKIKPGKVQSAKLPKTTIDKATFAEAARILLHSLRDSRSYTDVRVLAKNFIEKNIYPGRNIRISFAQKTELNGDIFLEVVDPKPVPWTGNNFSYPHTIAAWALIEGKIFAYPDDVDLKCNFDLLLNLKKFDTVFNMLLSLDPKEDLQADEFLDIEKIKAKTLNKTLTLEDIYQDWKKKQPKPHYNQFISIPVPLISVAVPVVDIAKTQASLPEYCVINIDTAEESDLLDDKTRPSLEFVSEAMALSFDFLDKRGH